MICDAIIGPAELVLIHNYRTPILIIGEGRISMRPKATLRSEQSHRQRSWDSCACWQRAVSSAREGFLI
jgi:hypothetical protein